MYPWLVIVAPLTASILALCAVTVSLVSLGMEKASIWLLSWPSSVCWRTLTLVICFRVRTSWTCMGPYGVLVTVPVTVRIASDEPDADDEADADGGADADADIDTRGDWALTARPAFPGRSARPLGPAASVGDGVLADVPATEASATGWDL